jgi:hypothetical protein
MTSEEEVEMGTYASSRSGVRSTLIAVAVAAVAFAAAAVPASAYEFTPTWGYAQIDDAPFHEPAGALLPVSQAFPRGRIKDAGSPDGWKVKITVFAFNASGQNLYSYSLTEGAAVYTAFDRRIDVSPNQISYLRFDFCRADGLCEPSLRIGRPSPPPPPPPPPGSGGSSPAPVDRDGDGVSPPEDCSDTNSTVWPGAPESPGNGIDDDCMGGDRLARLGATVSSAWSVMSRSAKVLRMNVRDAPPGARVTVLCRGSGRCPFRSRELTTNPDGEVSLTRLFRSRLRVGTQLEVRVTAPNMIGKVVRYSIRRGRVPRGRTLCLPPGAAQPSGC